MYSLIVTGDSAAWQGTAYEFPRDRIFENPDDQLTSRLKALTDSEIAEITANPVLFAFEGYRDEVVRIGRISRMQVRSQIVRIEYSFIDGGPLLTSAQLKAARWELDIQEWEFSRRHWAVKDIDLWAALVESKLLTAEQVASMAPGQPTSGTSVSEIKPLIFRVPGTGIESDLVSVMMPFGSEFTDVFETINEACLQQGLRCLKADQIWNESEVIQDIFSLIYRSKIVVCDFSGKNANVFYEAGIAHTLGRFVIPLAQSPNDVPFDIRHHRYLAYANDDAGLKDMGAALSSRLMTLKARAN